MERLVNHHTPSAKWRMHRMSRGPSVSVLVCGLFIALLNGLVSQAQAQVQQAVPMQLASNGTAAATTQNLTGAANPNLVNAERLIDMLELEKTTNAALAEMIAALNSQMQQLSVALKARGVDPDPTAKEVDALVKRFQARVNWAQLKPSLSQIMQDSYTPEQLQAVVDFMGSPVMQGLPAKMAQANKKTDELLRGQVSQLSADIQRVVNKAVTQPVKAPAVSGAQAKP